jgi:hypothetical protein
MAATNCWEFKDCGREPGGAHAGDLGVCPAAELKAADGLHGGRNGGRACWGIVGTLCAGEVQDSMAAKLRNCVGCDFHRAVEAEEGRVLSPPEIRRAVEA